MKNKKLTLYIIPIIVAIFNVLIILFPKMAISSTKNGILLWFNAVVPSLLPFIIGSNLLINLGFVEFMGVLLEPLMQKLFLISGKGSTPFILGMFSGYPMGAKITCDLRINNQINKIDAQKLLCFTNNSGPLFIIGTIGLGLFQNEKLGYLMLIIHYLSAITVGLLFRNYKKNTYTNTSPNIKKALNSLIIFREKQNLSIGEILSTCIKNSIETIVNIGGFIILFSVISELIISLLSVFNTNNSILQNGIIVGIIEITNGAKIISQEQSILSVIIILMLVSFGGFSIHAQTSSIISKTDLSTKIYILSKIIHSILAGIYSLLFIPIFRKILSENIAPTFSTTYGEIIKTSTNTFLITLIIIILIAIVNLFFHRK